MQYSKRLIAVYLGGILCVLTATTGNCGTNIIATVGDSGRPETFEVQTKNPANHTDRKQEQEIDAVPAKPNPRQDMIDRPTPLGGEIDYASEIRDKLVKKSKQPSTPPRNIIIFAVIAGLALTGLSYYRRMNS